MLKCPYCNNFLKQVHTTAYCYWCGCDKTDGMFGTLDMWKKLESLQKIRDANKRYKSKNKEKVNEYNRAYYRRKKNENN